MRNITNKLNQRQLAKKVGVTDSYISYLLNGKREPSLAMAQTMAKAMGMGLDRFILALRSIRADREDNRRAKKSRK